MDNLITRSDYESACDSVDAVSGTVTIKRCTEDNAARRFPNDSYLAYLDMIDNLNSNGIPESPYADLSPANRFERGVGEVVALLDADGTLYLPEYRAFATEQYQILYALNWHFGMNWIFIAHVEEAIKRKRLKRRKNI